MKELIEFITRKLVQHPDNVNVSIVDGEDGQVFELRVHPEDMGRVIGKNGRTAKALRTVLGSAAAKADVHVSLEIVD